MLNNLETAILKTLIYSDIFDFPLTESEIFLFLIQCQSIKVSECQEDMQKLLRNGQLEQLDGYYFLPGRKTIVELRQKRANFSRMKMAKAKRWSKWLKLNPWLKMVAVTGTVAVENAKQEDDIDLMFVFAEKRLFLGRLVEFIILKIMKKRRNPGQAEVNDVLCPNLYLTTESLEIKNKDLFTAHEVVQVKLLWDRENTYSKFIEVNRWIEKFLPNSKIELKIMNYELRDKKQETNYKKQTVLNSKIVKLLNLPGDWLEVFAKHLQLRYMQKKLSREQVSDSALFFHPKDVRVQVLQKYRDQVTLIVGETQV